MPEQCEAGYIELDSMILSRHGRLISSQQQQETTNELMKRRRGRPVVKISKERKQKLCR